MTARTTAAGTGFPAVAARRSPAVARRPALGLACAASGVLGVALGGITLGWTPAVDDKVWSYPFPYGAGLAIGVVLTITHALTFGGFVAVRSLTESIVGRIAGYAALAGFALLAVSETVGGLIGRQATDSAAASVVSGMFGIASLLVAVGCIVAGGAIVRMQRVTHVGAGGPSTRALGRLVLASGLVLLVVVTPANVSGDLTFRMASLMAWSALFVPLGGLLARTD
jgi:hypothetical protein